MALKKIVHIKQDDVRKKIHRFIVNNPYALTFGIVFTFLYLNYKIGSLTDTTEKKLSETVHFLKENIKRPIFLSASGMVLTVDRGNISYTDNRFINYLAYTISDNLIADLVEISDNYSKNVSTSNTGKFVKGYYRFNDFVNNFMGGSIRPAQKYFDAVRIAIIENRLPENMSISSVKMENYNVSSMYPGDKEKKDIKKISGVVRLIIVARSWYQAANKWDVRRVSVNISFKGVIDVAKYGNIGNPFGVRFNEIKAPAITKSIRYPGS